MTETEPLKARLGRFFRERVRAPLLNQLKKGATPEGLARSVAVSIPLSVFPIWGTTMILCFVVGSLARLNHVAMQVANQLVSLVHLALIRVYVRLGEVIFRLDHHTLNPKQMIEDLKASPKEFITHYGEALLGACGAWLVTAPLVGFAIYFATLPLFRKFAARLPSSGAPS